VDNLKKHCNIQDPAKLEAEAERFERAIVTTSTQNGRQGIVQLPGVSHILKELAPGRHLPSPCWAICTSATREYASSALRIAGIPIPEAFVAAEDVTQGKPSPDPYLLGTKLCGVRPENCLVVENAPSGLRSGRAAGCKTLGLITTHSQEQMEACQPDFLVTNLSSVTMRRLSKGVEVTVTMDSR